MLYRSKTTHALPDSLIYVRLPCGTGHAARVEWLIFCLLRGAFFKVACDGCA